MLAYFGYTQATLGPAMPFLGDELSLSYTVRGLHFSAFAFGMVTAGLSADRVSRVVGRRRLFWLGGLGMALGAVLFIVFKRAELTILSSLVMGALGGQTLVVIQAALSDRHGERRAIAISEANLTASFGGSLAPLMVGGLQRIDVGWRGSLVLSAIFWAVLYGIFRGDMLPRAPSDADETEVSQLPVRLPSIYWAYVLVLFLGVAIEWSMIFWGADFLENGIGLKRDNAVTAMVIFFVAIPIGRAAGSGLSRRFSAQRLLLMAFALVILGFFPFWLVRWLPLNLLGLFITGIGVANLFPLGLSVASSVVSPRLSDAASGRVSLAAGAAILIAPQILGSLADQVGISNAYGVVAVLSVVAIVVMFRAAQMQLTNE
jgi:fucose permease